MDDIPRTEKQTHLEKQTKHRNFRKFLARVAFAGAALLPVADYFSSDAGTARALPTIEHVIDLSPKPLDRAAEDATVGAAIVAANLLIAGTASRNKRMQTAFTDYDEYLTKKRAHMSKPRRLLSKAGTLPFDMIGKAGEAFQNLGEKAMDRKSKVARTIGKLSVDTGMVNAMGVPFAAMEETINNGKNPSWGRLTYLSSLFAGSWLGGAEAIRGIAKIPYVEAPLHAFGAAFTDLTTVNIPRFWETPRASTALGLIGASFAVSAWNAAGFSQQKELMPTAENITIAPDAIVPPAMKT